MQNTGRRRPQIRITIPKGDRDDKAWQEFGELMGASRIVVLDNKGKAIQQDWRNVNRYGDKIEFQVNLSQSAGPPAESLIWYVPLETEEMPVPFEFQDLPVPR